MNTKYPALTNLLAFFLYLGLYILFINSTTDKEDQNLAAFIFCSVSIVILKLDSIKNTQKADFDLFWNKLDRIDDQSYNCNHCIDQLREIKAILNKKT